MILIVASKFDKSGGSVIETLISSATEVLEDKNQTYRVIRVRGAVEIPVTVVMVFTIRRELGVFKSGLG